MNKAYLRNLVRLMPVVGLFLAGCSITDPTVDLAVRVSIPPTGSVIGGQIKDSFGRLITSEVTINVGGPDSAAVVDLLNNKISRLTTESGFVVMAINDTLPVSNAFPKRLMIYAEAEGYLPSAATVVVGGSQSAFEIRMVSTDINNLPEGIVGVEVAGTTDNSGALLTPLNITPPENATGTATTLIIGAGTTFIGANGQPLQGNIDVKFIHGELAADSTGNSAGLIPGGSYDMKTDDGQSIAPVSISSLFAVDESGNVGSVNGGSIEYSTQIPAGTMNPRTLQPIAAGDTVMFYSQNDEGEAVDGREGIAVGPDLDGNFTVAFIGINPVSRRDSRQVVISSADGAWEDFVFYTFIIAFAGFQDHAKSVLYIWPAMQGREVAIGYRPTGWHDLEVDGFFAGGTGVGKGNYGEDTVATIIFLLPGYQSPPEEVTFPVYLYRNHRFYAFEATDTATVTGRWNGLRNILTINGDWPFPPPPNRRTVNVSVLAKMPEGREPSEIRPSGLYAQVADAADTSSWRPVGAVQQGRINVDNLEVGKSYYFKGTYTFRGQTRTANTPWTRLITAQTDTLQYWYQLNADEADDYERQ